MIVSNETVRDIVKVTGCEATQIISNNSRLVVNIDSTTGVKARDCEVTTQQLRAVLDLRLLLLNGIEVSSTEFNVRTHTALKTMCTERTISTGLPQNQMIKRQSGILKLSISSLGSRILQLFSVFSKAVILSGSISIATSIKLRESCHCTTLTNRKPK